MNTYKIVGLFVIATLSLGVLNSFTTPYTKIAPETSGHSNKESKTELYATDPSEFQAFFDTIFGCTYPWADGYNPEATVDDGSCVEYYCCPGDINGDSFINVTDLIQLLGIFNTYCDESIIYGCTDPSACNYDEDANSNTECEYIYGCLDPLACNYDPDACLESPDEECIYPNADSLCCGCTAGGIQLDFTGPQFTVIPEDQNNECEEEPYAYEFSDSCMGNDAISVTETRDTTYTDNCGNYAHLVTVTATDSCGNSSFIQFTITVQDNEEPYLFVGDFPSDTTISCTEEWPEIEVINGADNCDGSVPVFFNETIAGGQCAGSYDIIRTWLIEDCSNNEQMHQQTITVIDDAPPFFTLAPQDQNNQCEEQPYFAEAFDNCNDATIIETRDTLYSDLCGNYEHLVTLSATDSCGNFTDTTFTIIVQDTEPPVWTVEEFPPVNSLVSCEDVPEPIVFTASDNCDEEVLIEFFEATNNPDCANDQVLVRTWIASDCSGNSITFTQTITIEDTQAPEFNELLPVDVVVECDDVPAAEILTAYDNCDSAVQVIFTETLEPGSCPQQYTLIREWTAGDCAGNEVNHVQTVTVDDTTAPIFTELPADQNNQCAEETYASAAVDNCGNVTITESREVISEDECGNYEHLVTLTATDECANSTIHQFTIIVADTEAPLFAEAVPQDESVECDDIPEAVILTATDNCDDSVEVLFDEEVTDGNCPQAFTITRTWTVSDCSGNTTTHTQVIDVQDTTAPIFVSLPEDQNNQCEEEPYDSDASDNCGMVAVTESRDVISEDECGNYEHLVTLTATDECGNTTSHSFTIIVADTIAPVFVEELPQGAQLNCSDGIPTPAVLTAVDNCDIVDVAFSEEMIVTDACVTTFVRTWFVEDCSGNSTEHVQELIITDDVAPEFTSLPEAVIVIDADHECNADTSVETWGAPTVDDACSTWTLEFADSDSNPLCTGSYAFTRTWTAMDACGNTSTFEQSFTIEDVTPPTLFEPASDLIVECTGDADASILNDWLNENGGAQAEDNCSAIIWSHDFESLGTGCEGGAVDVTFTAIDDCGNETTTTATVQFTDTTAPEITVAAQSNTVECDGSGNEEELELWLSTNGAASATDACSENIIWTNNFTELDPSCGLTGMVEVTFYVSDECNNVDSTMATFTILDTTPPEIIGDDSEFTVECDGLGNEGDLDAWLNNNAGLTANEVCGDVTWTHNFDGLILDCGATGSAEVWFFASDDCNNVDSTAIAFTIVDTAGPTLVQEAMDLTVECDGAGNDSDLNAWLASNGGAEATDVCSETITWTNDFDSMSDDCGATGSATVTFTAADACGNMTSTTATFTIQDSTAPSIQEPASDITVQCDGNGNTAALNSWLGSQGGSSAIDSCSGVSWTHNFEALTPSCGGTGSATVTFYATDECGNQDSTLATFAIIDTLPPMFTSLPVDQNNQCEELSYTSSATDGCGDVTIEESREVIFEDACGNYEHVVTLTASDGCGNEAEHIFTIIVQDTIAPEWNSDIPLDVTVGCGEIPDAILIEASDNCDEAVNVIFTSDTIPSTEGCGASFTLIRTWEATDCSGNTATAVQEITVVDDETPVWDVEIPEFLIVECDEVPDPSTITASDNCDEGVTIDFEETYFPGPCPSRYTLERVWTATDDCGNSITANQTLTVVDTTAPEWVSPLPPSVVTVTSCADIPAPAILESADNCDSQTFVIYNEFFSPASGCSDVCECGGVVVRTWISADCMGNLATFVQYYNVLNPGE